MFFLRAKSFLGMKMLLNKSVLFLLLFSLLVHACAANDAVVAISIPKCGTWLLANALTLLTGKRAISPEPWDVLNKENFKPRRILASHALYIEKNVALLSDTALSCKIFFIYRDPRDEVVSLVHMLQSSKRFQKFKDISIEHLISKTISDCGPLWEDFFVHQQTSKKIWKNLKTVSQFYDLYAPWITHKNVCVVRFEDLIGPNGGGDKNTQVNTIERMSKHLGLNLSMQKIDEVACKMFGGTVTFREGQIGSWKKHFTEEHKKAFKAVAGQLLIGLGYEKDPNW